MTTSLLRRSLVLLVGLAPISFALTACPGGSLKDPERFAGLGGFGGGTIIADTPESCDAKPIFEQNCGSSACHAGADTQGGTDLISDGVASRILDAPATYKNVDDQDNCPDPPELIIDSDNIDDSLLLTKLLGTHSCGDPMPPFGSGLSDDDLACVKAWITEVVENGGPIDDSTSGMGGGM